MTKSKSTETGKKRSNPRRALAQQLRSVEQAGVTHVRRPPPAKPRAKRAATAAATATASRPGSTSTTKIAGGGATALRNAATTIAARTPGAASPSISPTLFADGAQGLGPALPRKERIAQLQILSDQVAGCQRCPQLASTRHKTVFGVGNPQARLCFLGEAPGADEDRQGEPFVGRAGQLLTKIIEACKLRREDVYILNVLKCRPPGNRNPLPDEAANCRGYLEGQLAIIRPEFICALGAVAARMLLNTPAPIGKLRGQFFNYGTSQVLCTYHPAFLLRNPPAKKDVWEDMQLLMARMGTPVGKTPG